MVELIYKNEVYATIGAAMAVHTDLGAGFLEAVYQEAMEIELLERGIPYQAQAPISISYRNRLLKKKYQVDFICYEKVLVEIKSIRQLTENEEAQIFNYLRATKLKVGVLINFGSYGKLEWRRYVH
jgi:GxxExxY protein